MKRLTDRPVHLIVISGLARGPLADGLASGYLSGLSFLAGSGRLQMDCVAPFPSVTPPGVASLVTGLAPARHGVLGRAWFDRGLGRVREFRPEQDAGAPAGSLLTSLRHCGRQVVTVNVPPGLGGTLLGLGEPDRSVAHLTREAIRGDSGDLLISFLRDYDATGHGFGPEFSLPGLWRADRALRLILEAYGSWKDAVAAARWILVGDHGFSDILGGPPRNMVDPATLTHGNTDVSVVPNARAAFLYCFGRDPERTREHLVEDLARMHSVDQIFWRESGWTRARREGTAFAWRPGGPMLGLRGGRWEIAGDPRILGLRVEGMRLRESDYSDPLCRVDELLDSINAPEVVITARPGFTFAWGRRQHGSHGSLLADDSLVPLMTAGFGDVADGIRSRDLASLIAGALGAPWGAAA